MNQLSEVLNIVFLVVSGIYIVYLSVFSVASRFRIKQCLPRKNVRNRFLIIIPAYKADVVIEETVEASINQKYERELFDVLVVSDSMAEATDEKLTALGAYVLNVYFENSTKAQSLKSAISYIEKQNKVYDYVLILDADNIIYPDFLSGFEWIDSDKITAIQCHRIAKNIDTDIALLDAVSEEMNNSIYRQGHVNCHISSALIGSGMLFSFSWFCKSVDLLKTVGEDKELELMLLSERKFIYYSADAFVLDEKVRKSSNFYNQRRRWIAAQFESFSIAKKYLPNIFNPLNIGFVDKLFQWLIPPRIMLLGGLFVWTIIVLLFHLSWLGIWLLIDMVFLTALMLAIPANMYSSRLMKALCKVPYLFILMIFNIFRLRNATKSFIHTNRNS